MRARALLLAFALLPCGFAAGAEDMASTGAADPNAVATPLQETVSLGGADYLTQIDRPVVDQTTVNGAAVSLAPAGSGSVRVARADGGSMADEGYRAREVLSATCAAQGMIANAGAAPILGSDGAWVFVEGCL
ncbi:hypothetical protein Q9295_09815 [Xinfangfangia sp. CPCC 101601]|uniref:Secreted protein n=1 Tax=Pseudogemmobacter lacusdianii TaxID=3069608 RepID=A0ABU0VY38_9RHOB|nr:hypothetical protein [Xinfangfangia sp. CPCC 101601]MDQ2066672.1 hypothetical protein [Xinfangfangia sp. CPCC 101601]